MSRVQVQRFIDLAEPSGARGAGESGVLLNRRRALGLGAALAVGGAMAPAAMARDFTPGAPPVRYPEPDVVVLDERFRAKLGNAPIERLYHGTLWAEGPAWNGVGRYLVWSDIPNNEQLRWLEEDGHVGRRFRSPSRHSNGNTFDFEGRQIAFCLNAPNDGMVHPDDGSIWFTDPGYGALMDYEGRRVPEAADSPQPFIKEAIYRIDAQTGAIRKVADEPFKPNGMCFSHDYTRVYVADTGPSHYPEAEAKIWVYDVDGDRLVNPRTFATTELDGRSGFADGLRADEDGNVWAGMGWVGDGYDGVHIFAPDGDRIGQIRLPEICANISFGGSKRNRLFMAASTSLYAVHVETRGAHIA
jgi:gluconolactonase